MSADLGFSVADGEAVTLSFDGGDLELGFKDWREQNVQHRFVEVLAFRWSARPTVATPRDDSVYEVRDSWLLDELQSEGYSAHKEFVHHVVCFNAAKVLEVISRRTVTGPNADQQAVEADGGTSS